MVRVPIAFGLVSITHTRRFSMRHHLITAATIALGATCLGQGVTIHGLDHTALGNAQLVVQGDELLVTGLTGSGLDGVSTDVSGAGFYNVSFMPDSPPLGPAPFVRIDALADISGFVQPAVSITSTNLGGAFGIRFDPESLIPKSIAVMGYLDDKSVFQTALDNSWGSGLFDVVIPSFPNSIGVAGNNLDNEGALPKEIFGIIDLDRPGLVEIPTAVGGPSSALLDRVVIVIEHLGAAVDELEQVQIIGTGVQQFTVTAEQLGWKGYAHESIGGATLGINNGVLTVGGLGGIVDKGLRVEAEPLVTGQADNGLELDLAPIGLVFPGQSITQAATGPLVDGTIASLGTSTLERSLFQTTLSADFSTIGAPEARIIGWLQDDVQFDMLVPSDAILGTFDNSVLVEGTAKLPPDPPCFQWDFGDGVNFDPIDPPTATLAPFTVDRIAVLAHGTEEIVAGLSSLSLLTNKAGSITILDETTLYGNAFTDLGGALAGSNGEPQLSGEGTLLPGSDNLIALDAALPGAPAMLFYSLGAGAAPFKGGTLQTIPVLGSLMLITDNAGSIALPVTWPDVPELTPTFQFAIADRGAVKGVALSNAVQGLSK